MAEKKHKGGRPHKGSTKKRDAIEGIELELIILMMDIDEIDQRAHQALLRTQDVDDVLMPAIDRLGQMRSSIQLIKAHYDAAWDAEQSSWRTQ